MHRINGGEQMKGNVAVKRKVLLIGGEGLCEWSDGVAGDYGALVPAM